jgi:excisionase family DNA binding protein
LHWLTFEQKMLNRFKTNAKMKEENIEIKKWLSSDEVCRLLGISKRTLQNYRDNRIIPFSQIGRKLYFKSCDIDDYLDRHYIKARYQKGGGYGN